MQWDDDESDLRVGIRVLEPFATAFRLTHTNLYDLLNNMANALRLPRHGFTNVTHDYLEQLYRIIAGEFDAGEAHQAKAAQYAARALSYVERDELEDLLRDLDWFENLFVQRATLGTFESELREQFARRMGGRVERLLRRLGAPGVRPQIPAQRKRPSRRGRPRGGR